ncbi:phosphotransferase [Neisseria perflava]|uniref:phosphotransferase n=1 Tax=Neisseria perflava TaxID=33053 RepID=UPI00209E75D0|nr:phosphotransferase [Neisseria perflava]MCP1659867.1 aminoglycoside phosphotransferase (APT) family kinase protein [Neisseria perflava]MCP1772671.1 aminoglycoside phosphotransferase (APT) family kinase protein [Neisseria perflava]
MLTEADQNIIANDTALPGLAILLDTERLLATLQTIEPFKQAVSAQIQYLRYKPATSCACTLHIKLADASEYFYYAKALTQTRFKESWNRSSVQKALQVGGQFVPYALPDVCIILQHPMYDRGIGHLKWLTSKKHRRHILRACSLPATDRDEPDVKILRYKPERRLVARVSRHGHPIAILRSASPDEFTKMLIGNAFGVSHGGVLLLGADGTSCTLATKWQKGRSLCPEHGTPPDAELTRELARKLSRIHAATYRHPTCYGIAEEIQALQGVANTFKHILPLQTAWFENLSFRVKQNLAELPERFTLIHSDFSLDQVIRRESRHGETKLHILDWDRSAYGHPLMDLATFQARLELQVIEGILPRWQADTIIGELLTTYRRKSENDLTGLVWFTASAMLRLATEPFRKRLPRWDQYVLLLLQRVELLLASSEWPSEKPSNQTVNFDADPMLDTLLNRHKMQHLLSGQHILSEHESVVSASLRRYKIKRRALVNYAIASHSQDNPYLIGKYRAKGLDKRSYRIQKQLWQSGLNDQAQTGVPKVAGAIPELNTWFQYRISGETIGDMLLPQNGRLKFLGEAVANALSALHQSNVANQLDLPFHTPQHELAILQKRLADAQNKLPQLAERIAAVSAACATLIDHLPETTPVCIHRDFYQDQILERHGHPGHMVLFDLDLVCQGQAAVDAGNYLAHIQEFALRQYNDINALKVHEDAFKTQFLRNRPNDAEAVEIYITLSLARHIDISTLFENRTHTTETLLEICESRLASHCEK